MFLILSPQDKPLYEKQFQSKKSQQNSGQILNAQFQLHSSLDLLDEKLVNQKELFIKDLDTNRIYGYVTPTSTQLCPINQLDIRFLVQSDQDEDKVKGFCMQAHEHLIRIIMNPLYDQGSPITSLYFDYQIQQLIQNKLNS